MARVCVHALQNAKAEAFSAYLEMKREAESRERAIAAAEAESARIAASSPRAGGVDLRRQSEQWLAEQHRTEIAEQESRYREEAVSAHAATTGGSSSGRPPPRRKSKSGKGGKSKTKRSSSSTNAGSSSSSSSSSHTAAAVAAAGPTFSRDMSVQDVCAWVRSSNNGDLATIEQKFRAEEVCGEMLALYATQNDHTLLKQDLNLTAGRARALHGALCAFVHGHTDTTAVPSGGGGEGGAQAQAAAEAQRRWQKLREQQEREVAAARLKRALELATQAGEWHKLAGLAAELQAIGGGGVHEDDEEFEGRE